MSRQAQNIQFIADSQLSRIEDSPNRRWRKVCSHSFLAGRTFTLAVSACRSGTKIKPTVKEYRFKVQEISNPD